MATSPGQPRDPFASGIPLPGKTAAVVLLLLIAVYAIFFSLIGDCRYRSYSYDDMDLAAINQAFYNGVHGRLYTANHIGESALFNNHRWLIALPLLPLYALFPSPITLLVLQSLAAATGAGAVYLLARKLLNPVLGLAFAVCYLIYPPVNFVTLYEFHPIVFFIPLVLFAGYFYERRNWPLYLLFLLLSLACREDTALPVFGLGIYLLLREGAGRPRAPVWWRWGAAAAASSLLWFFLCLRAFPFLMSRIYPETVQSNLIPIFFGWLGRTPAEILGTIITRPGYVASGVLTGPKLLYLFQLLVPLGFLSLLSPAAFLPVLFGAAASLLSARSQHFSLSYQYTALVTPFVFLAAIRGGRNLIAKIRLREGADYLLLFLLVVAPFASARIGPLFRLPSMFRHWQVTQEDVARERLIARIPENAPVLATFGLASHLSGRPQLFYSFQFCGGWQPGYRIDVPLVQRTARFALIDFNDPLTFNYFFGPDGDLHLRRFLHDGWRLEETVQALALFSKGETADIGLVGRSDLNEAGQVFTRPVKSAPGLVLRGYTVAPGRRLGYPVIEISVFFECVAAVAEDYLLGATFRRPGAGGFAFGQYFFAPYRILPTSRWGKGEIIRQRCAILVPENAPEGDYEMVLALVRPVEGSEFPGEIILTASDAVKLP